MWARNYYDLVAGLADIRPDTSRLPFGSAEFIADIAALVHPDDAKLLRLLQLPRDNRNLITLLEKRGRPFEPGGAYDRELLAAEIETPEALPDYMCDYIAAYRADELPLPELSGDDRMAWLFFEFAAGHENAFIAAWFSFERALRNILAALAVRRGMPHLQQREPEYLKCLESVLVCRTGVEERLLTSAAPDFGLAAELPWIARVLELPADDLVERERALDLLRGDMLDELTVLSHFQIETLLAFCMRLMLAERWTRLDPQTGRRRLEQLVRSLKPGARAAA